MDGFLVPKFGKVVIAPSFYKMGLSVTLIRKWVYLLVGIKVLVNKYLKE
jgi:hypothetical protein